MSRLTAGLGISRGILAGLAVLLAGAAFIGCGLGPGESRGGAGLIVTRDYGSEVLLERSDVGLTESSTAMRVLDGAAGVETAYGGGFVQSVDGIAGGGRGGRSLDWFYSVNGVVAERGSAEFPLADGDTVWWDYRDWTDAMQVGAVVGVWPAPFSTGYDGRRWPTAVECATSERICSAVEERLRADGADLAPTEDRSSDGGPARTIRVLVGTWSGLRDLPEGQRLAGGPGRSGVFARFEGASLVALDVTAKPAVNLGPDAGLVAAMRQGQAPPVWIVTGGSRAGVDRAVQILDREDLARRYAAVAVAGKVGSLPWTEDGGT